MQVPIDWLLDGEPYVSYRTRRDLLGEAAGSGPVVEARREMLADPQVRSLVDGLAGWPGTVIASHKSAGQPFHRLTFVADLGLRADDPGVSEIVAAVRAHQSAEGPYQLPTNVPQRYGGTGVETWAWALCDAPLLVYGWRPWASARIPACAGRWRTSSVSYARTAGRAWSRGSSGASGGRERRPMHARSPRSRC